MAHLVEQEIENAPAASGTAFQRAEGDDVQDEFAEQGGDCNDAAGFRQRCDHVVAEIEGSHFDPAGHAESVFDAIGDPDGSIGRDDPGTAVCGDGHHARPGIDQLVAVVEMEGDLVPVGEVERERDQIEAWIPVGQREFALNRHILAL